MTPNRRQFWKRLQPATLRDALALCKDHAKERHNRGVERIAELMGLEDHFALYKWIANGRMPAINLPAFQAACGIDLVTRWLARSSGKLLVDVPTGTKSASQDMVALNASFAATLQLLGSFYADPGATDHAALLSHLRTHLAEVAHHHANVQLQEEPQLDFSPTNPDAL